MKISVDYEVAMILFNTYDGLGNGAIVKNAEGYDGYSLYDSSYEQISLVKSDAIDVAIAILSDVDESELAEDQINKLLLAVHPFVTAAKSY